MLDMVMKEWLWGDVVPGGTNLQIQYNNNGQFGGVPNWTNQSGVLQNKQSVGGTLTTGLSLTYDSTVPATSGTQQNSPGILLSADGWNTGAGGPEAYRVDWLILNQAISSDIFNTYPGRLAFFVNPALSGYSTAPIAFLETSSNDTITFEFNTVNGTNRSGYYNSNSNVGLYVGSDFFLSLVGNASVAGVNVGAGLILGFGVSNIGFLTTSVDAALGWNATNTLEVNQGKLTSNSGSFGSLKVADLYTNDASFLIRAGATLNNGAASSTGTLLNAPSAGNPTKWIPIDDNGTTRYFPAW